MLKLNLKRQPLSTFACCGLSPCTAFTAKALRRHPRPENLAAITTEELDKAERDAIHFQRLSGGGKTPPKTIEAATDEHDRSVTLFIRNYDQVRRAICFLRWNEDDLETIAPGLSGGKKQKQEEKQPLKPVVSNSVIDEKDRVGQRVKTVLEFFAQIWAGDDPVSLSKAR